MFVRYILRAYQCTLTHIHKQTQADTLKHTLTAINRNALWEGGTVTMLRGTVVCNVRSVIKYLAQRYDRYNLRYSVFIVDNEQHTE